MTKRDVPGFAIGGLSGGEEKDDFWRMVTLSTDHLPREKPRYLMGVGYVCLFAENISWELWCYMFFMILETEPVWSLCAAGMPWIWWCV